MLVAIALFLSAPANVAPALSAPADVAPTLSAPADVVLALSGPADIIPARSTPADVTPAAARRVVERYYRAIDRRDYRVAYRLWGDAGRRSGQRYAAFVRGFAGTASTRVVAGAPRDGDAGAGSIWVTVPVDVHARLKDGRRQHFRGAYVLRRVNGVDGATPAQLAWHIDSARLTRVGQAALSMPSSPSLR